MLNCFGMYFGWGESPKKIKIEYALSATGNWVVASDVPLNVAIQLYRI